MVSSQPVHPLRKPKHACGAPLPVLCSDDLRLADARLARLLAALVDGGLGESWLLLCRVLASLGSCVAGSRGPASPADADPLAAHTLVHQQRFSHSTLEMGMIE